jgi:uncharacterized protein (TIGR02757 family)
MPHSSLKTFLETQYSRYHRPEYLCMDPLVCLQKFTAPRDLEIAGLVAAALAYGRVEIIIRNVSRVFALTGNSIADFALEKTLREKLRAFHGFKHRFNDGNDIAHLLHGIGRVCREHGSLELFFVKGLSPGDETVKPALCHFTCGIKSAMSASTAGRRRRNSLEYLLPSPESGSACKRLNMYLRWMIRENDGIDCGVWRRVPASLLVMPLDTHVARIAGSLGLTTRKSVGWPMAEEITARLRAYDPRDPVRYDFSLCRSGMVDFRRKAA